MKISEANISDFGCLADFNARIYPEKGINSKSYLDFWLSKTDARISDYIIIKDDEGRIQGQILSSPMSYYFNRVRKESEWLFDLIIEEGLRKTAWGVDLLLACMEAHPASCSTGSGPVALPLHLKLGNKKLGEIRKYVGIVNPLYFLSSFHRKIVNIDKYPKEVITGTSRYIRITKNELPKYEGSFNENLFEIARDQEFLKWRFFNDLHQYAFYLAEDGLSYFVARSVLLKGFRVLDLVDFRCKADEGSFAVIVKAAHKIAKATHLPAVVCGSTLAAFDTVLERHHYRSIGRPRPVIGFVKCKERKEDIAKRNFCFVTLADSDGETNWV